MARDKYRKIGFNPNRIVDVEAPKKEEPKTKSEKLIQTLKEEAPEKQRVFVYLDNELAFKVKEYGKQVGRANGGSSRIISEALKDYFKKYNL